MPLPSGDAEFGQYETIDTWKSGNCLAFAKNDHVILRSIVVQCYCL